MLDLTPCPGEGCTAPASISDRSVVDSTDGPVELVRVSCAAAHHFLMPAAGLAPWRTA